jgi:hypothetical protein
MLSISILDCEKMDSKTTTEYGRRMTTNFVWGFIRSP